MNSSKEIGKDYISDFFSMIKGIAILMMMWHHCFLKGRFENYSILFYPFSVAQITRVAGFFKICVSFFAFISGYGFFHSYIQRNQNESAAKWIIRRYLKSFLRFWFVFALAFVLCTLIDDRPTYIYFTDNNATGIINILVDFLGLNKLFGTPSLNEDWWYMSAYFTFIVLTPLLCFSLEKWGSLITILLLVVYPRINNITFTGTHVFSFLLAFVMGMVFAKEDLFSKISVFIKEKRSKHVVFLMLLFLSVGLYIVSTIVVDRNRFWDIIWGLYPVVYIVMLFLSLSSLRYTQQILRFLGKHSSNIYWTHTFIRAYYFSDYIYGCKFFLLIIICLTLSSIVVSFIIEWLKSILHYDDLQNKIDTLFLSH